MAKLAIEGGPKEITTPLPWTGYGKELTGTEEETYVLQVLRSKRLNRAEFANDEESFCARLEMALEKYLGVKHVYLMNSCSTALLGAMHALGIGPGDEVIVPSITWMTGPFSVVLAGAVPVIAQVDETATLDIADVERLINPRTRAIMPVHMLGTSCNMDAIQDLAKKHNLLIVEDVAQAMGGSYHGKMLGSIGDANAFSFHPAKTVAAGDGGFLATNRDDVYEFIMSFADGTVFPHRKASLNGMRLPATNFRMNELTAAVALAQFERLEKMLGHLRSMRDLLLEEIRGLKHSVVVPGHDPKGDCALQIMLKFEDTVKAVQFEDALRAEGVPMIFTNTPGSGILKSSAEYMHQMHALANHKLVHGLERAGAAPYWNAIQDKRGIHPLSNPWTHPAYTAKGGGDIEYQGVVGIMPTMNQVMRLLVIRLNPRMEPEHIRAIARAIHKVDENLFPET
jgi:dTDP-4-amino-4,6-dideoxygalactose transaminase